MSPHPSLLAHYSALLFRHVRPQYPPGQRALRLTMPEEDLAVDDGVDDTDRLFNVAQAAAGKVVHWFLLAAAYCVWIEHHQVSDHPRGDRATQRHAQDPGRH